MMEMANRDSQRIRCVMRLRNGTQRQKHTDHLLDLLLVCVAVSRNRLLDASRRVLSYLQRGALSDQQSDAPNLSELQSNFGID